MSVVAIVLLCSIIRGFYQGLSKFIYKALGLGIESVVRFNSELAKFIGCLHFVLSEVYCFYSMTGWIGETDANVSLSSPPRSKFVFLIHLSDKELNCM